MSDGMDSSYLLNIIAVGISVTIVASAFISKSIIWGIAPRRPPQEINIFGRIFLFIVGSIGVYEFGFAIYGQNHPAYEHWQSATSVEVINLFVLLFIVIGAVSFLVRDIRSLLRGVKRNEESRLLSLFRDAIIVFVLTFAIPALLQRFRFLLHV